MGSEISKEKTLDDYYLLEKELARGSTGTVFLYRKRETSKEDWPELIAVKSIYKFNHGELISNEIKILEKLKHGNVVRLHASTGTKRMFHICFEYMPGGELLERIIEVGVFTESLARVVLREVIQGLKYCHKMGVAHRDLKPENLLLDETKAYTTVKICDFGMSKVFDNGMKTFCGSPLYTAPEIFIDGDYGKECDMWSVGVILFLLLSGTLPFYSDNFTELQKLILAGKFSMEGENWDGVSENARDLIRRLIVVDPSERLNCSEVMAHPFVTSWETYQDEPRPEIVIAGIRQMVARRRWNFARNAMKAVFAFGGFSSSSSPSSSRAPSPSSQTHESKLEKHVTINTEIHTSVPIAKDMKTMKI
eukprot:TRINITY_DN774017_c0_g1_i1.p1 TRINITY_DN774017_c0_g1~~TRINITY_DN774017_c0_g1_i1.p1  ORF type:complete len:364 (+),score=96.45 TRINITY_DN774017_c0_g1_i1:147-1238(+)